MEQHVALLSFALWSVTQGESTQASGLLLPDAVVPACQASCCFSFVFPLSTLPESRASDLAHAGWDRQRVATAEPELCRGARARCSRLSCAAAPEGSSHYDLGVDGCFDVRQALCLRALSSDIGDAGRSLVPVGRVLQETVVLSLSRVQRALREAPCLQQAPALWKSP